MNRMRLVVLGFLIVLLSCSLAGCGAVRTAQAAEDAKLWQGTWRLVGCTYNGGHPMADMHWIVDGEHYTLRLNGTTHTDIYPFVLDAGQKHIDINHHETPKGTYGGKFKGIYEISADSLTVCLDQTGQQYPTSFDASPGSRRVIYQFQREH